MMADGEIDRNATRYTKAAIALHWSTAAAFALQIGLGWRMGGAAGPQTFAIYQLHKSVGITILLLTLARIGWRLRNPPPPFPKDRPMLERRLASLVHLLFYVLLLGLPLSGWLIVSSSKVLIPTYLYGTIWWPHLPGLGDLPPGVRQELNGAAATGHSALGWISVGAIMLHVAGALKHQILDQSGDLTRMTGLPHQMLSAATNLLLAGFLALLIFGFRVSLPSIALYPRGVAPARLPSGPSPATNRPPAISAPTAPALSGAIIERIVPAASAATSTAWKVRRSASSITFHTAWSQGAIDGGFNTWRAKIIFDPEALAKAEATVTIDAASLFAADSEQQSALPEADWFSVPTHPTATWKATVFRHLGGERYEADGTLTMRGVSRPLALSFALSITGDVATMAGRAVIDRTLFGVGQGEWSSTADVPANVTVLIKLTADRLPVHP